MVWKGERQPFSILGERENYVVVIDEACLLAPERDVIYVVILTQRL